MIAYFSNKTMLLRRNGVLYRMKLLVQKVQGKDTQTKLTQTLQKPTQRAHLQTMSQLLTSINLI